MNSCSQNSGTAPDDEEQQQSSSSPLKCLSLLKPLDFSRRAEKLPEVYGQWRAEQRASAGRIERQLRTRRALDDLIDAQLARFDAHYNHSPLLLRPRDVARLLDPPWNPPLANAALSWLGDWRPSAILSLARILSSFSPPSSSLSSLSPRAHRTLAEAIRRLKVQEAVLDQQVEEWQVMASVKMASGKGVAEELAKMEEMVARSQKLRYKALELAVKWVLDRNQAAEFLVAFAGVQDLAHRHAERWRARVGPVSVAVQACLPAY
ncbi:hypothetical protein J5N97_002743 [Dioscorea zingiberensis]|uniref:DOG1 domain-containing protein n=1 Tax=Dioscorea zingiberensis TaxID=325984 RepID=A0A9D5D4W6_9LILI|nr:hypothetical protein J5N97_002743 [Dioscorea zingiberensis]